MKDARYFMRFEVNKYLLSVSISQISVIGVLFVNG